MNPAVDTRAYVPEFCDFALMPGSGVLEGFDAAGIDGRVVDGPGVDAPPARADTA